MRRRLLLFSGYAIFFGAVISQAAGCVMPPSSHTKPSFPVATFSDSPYRKLDSLPVGTILHVPTGIEVSRDQLMTHLSGQRIIYIGETHTNLKDHEVELDILKGLTERFPGRISVGMEMFQRPSQGVLDQWSRGSLSEVDFVREWHANWSQDYAYYRDILRYIRDHRIPLIALNASQALVRSAMEKGVEGLPENLARELPEMDRTDEYHRMSLKAVFGGHSPGDHGFERFYQTMLIWDETMAQSVASYLSSPEGAGKKILVFTGGFHVSYGFGVPRRVFKRLPEPYAIVLPYTAEMPENRRNMLMEVEPISIPLYLSDFVWSVGYEDIEDRTVRLGIQIGSAEEGVRILGVAPGSAAAKVGLRADDILVSFDGQAIREPFDLQHLVGMKKLGDRAQIRVLRGTEFLELEPRFEKMEEDP